MLLQLQPYHFEIVYKPGKQMHIADLLSRAPLPESDDFLDEDIAVHVNIIS